MNDGSSVVAVASILRRELARLAPGDRLPGITELTNRHHVGRGVLEGAIALLAAEGAVVTGPDGVAVVAMASGEAPTRPPADQSDPLLSAHALNLSGRHLHEMLQPITLLGSALARSARRPEAWREAPAAGLSSLRAAFARQVGRDVDANDVLVTAGDRGALSTLFRAVSASGSPVLVESPCEPGVLAAARAAGLRPVPVTIDADGMRPDLLAEAFRTTRARLLYCQPTFHNPTGAVLAAERRHLILDLAREARALVIEDDFARHLGHGRPVPPPLVADDRDGTVIHLTSLTPPTAPSLRIGAVVARGAVMERLSAVRGADDFSVARPLQEAAAEVLSSPGWDWHLRALAAALRERCAALAGGVARELPDWAVPRVPDGGLHLWVRLPSGVSDRAVAEAASACRVQVDPGYRYFVGEHPAGAPAHLRLSFAAAAETSELLEAVRRLAAVVGGREPAGAEPAGAAGRPSNVFDRSV